MILHVMRRLVQKGEIGTHGTSLGKHCIWLMLSAVSQDQRKAVMLASLQFHHHDSPQKAAERKIMITRRITHLCIREREKYAG